ncbi:MAG: dicarboxylate/amino acid:cation symporter [Lachnospiraceae bacterium]|nr:dicarboxylate/amino acid:cation symporter [Lachnospiraceae bacterium]
MRITRHFSGGVKSISDMVDFVIEELKSYGIKSKECIKASITVEEAAASLIQHGSGVSSKENDKSDVGVDVTINAFLGRITIEMSAEGEEYNFANDISSTSIHNSFAQDESLRETISNILLKSLTYDLKYRNINNKNYIRMIVIRSKNAMLYQTLGAMALAIIVGLLISNLMPGEIGEGLNKFVLVPIKTMYMNALKMVVAPVVFFSIVSCIVQFSDMTTLGRVGGKIIGMYVFTTFVAVSIGILIYYLLQPGDPSIANSLVQDASAITSQTMEVSLLDTIVGIVPSDIVNPFLKANMLQLIFMAIMCGVATGLLGKYSELLVNLFSAGNDLFLKITTLVIKVMPIAVFCSITSMVITMGAKRILSILGMLGTFLLGLFGMMIVYCLLALIIAHINPITLIRKYSSSMLQVFSMASSNASIPINMEACEKKLGISKKIFSLSIPLGATLNMDGTCVHLAVFALALAKSYGVEISEGMMLSMIISIVVLSMGAPGIPGSGLICLSVLLTQLNVPVEAIGLVMGVDPLIGMFRAMSNSLGDVVVTTIVAKTEGEIDMKVYNK